MFQGRSAARHLSIRMKGSLATTNHANTNLWNNTLRLLINQRLLVLLLVLVVYGLGMVTMYTFERQKPPGTRAAFTATSHDTVGMTEEARLAHLRDQETDSGGSVHSPVPDERQAGEGGGASVLEKGDHVPAGHADGNGALGDEKDDWFTMEKESGDVTLSSKSTVWPKKKTKAWEPGQSGRVKEGSRDSVEDSTDTPVKPPHWHDDAAVAQTQTWMDPDGSPSTTTITRQNAGDVALGGNRYFGPGLRTEGMADPVGMTFIRNMMKHAWKGYVDYAWGYDELKPISKHGRNWVTSSGMSASIIDALDTLYIMELHDAFKEAKDHVLHMNFDQNAGVSFFETTIRVLGGLLSAYDLSGDEQLISKAVDIGDRLLKGFRTPTGIPKASVNLHSGALYNGWTSRPILSEIGSVQMEFTYLSDITGNDIYKTTSQNVIKKMKEMKTSIPGLYPTFIQPDAVVQTGQEFALGGLSDSFYEYLLKMWLLEGKSGEGEMFRGMYDASVKAFQEHMVRETQDHFRYIGTMRNGRMDTSMEHLTCFSGGMFALGAVSKKEDGWQDIFKLAADITETCYQMYHKQALGLSPEKVDPTTFHSLDGQYYIQRPEVIESIFIMWRLTHDRKYRDWGMEIAKNIETHLKVATGGYSGLNNINTHPMNPTNAPITKLDANDNQESFFLAETLKYLYLLFTDDDVIPLETYVFNTEAHPLSAKPHRRAARTKVDTEQ